MLTAIIVAAGSSQRMGFDKLLSPIAGRTVIGHTLAAFQNCDLVESMIVVARAHRLHDFQMLLDGRFSKLRDFAAGGERRQDSVASGLAKLPGETRFVAVHDAARPLVSCDVIERVFREAEVHGAAAAAAPVSDTLKRATPDHVVSGGVEREGMFAMQTPQIFARDLLVEAYAAVEQAKLNITDEVSALEHLGRKVVLVPNTEPNFKVTFPDDLRLAEQILAARAQR
ncbi:MAG: 2-C-methyl-D-erythritol 4-phosphate cytidylyltransferase [Chthoniobacterales bacterium]